TRAQDRGARRDARAGRDDRARTKPLTLPADDGAPCRTELTAGGNLDDGHDRLVVGDEPAVHARVFDAVAGHGRHVADEDIVDLRPWIDGLESVRGRVAARVRRA